MIIYTVKRFIEQFTSNKIRKSSGLPKKIITRCSIRKFGEHLLCAALNSLTGEFFEHMVKVKGGAKEGKRKAPYHKHICQAMDPEEMSRRVRKGLLCGVLQGIIIFSEGL